MLESPAFDDAIEVDGGINDTSSITPVKKELKIPAIPKAPKKKSPLFAPQKAEPIRRVDDVFQGPIISPDGPTRLKRTKPEPRVDTKTQGCLGSANETSNASRANKKGKTTVRPSPSIKESSIIPEGCAETNLLEPDGNTRDIYVQGSE